MRAIAPKLATPAAAALFAPVAVASPAHAKPAPDPLTALRKQFAAGGGVTYTSRTTLRNKRIATTGAFRFGRSGLAASRLSTGLRVALPSLRENPLLEAPPEKTVKIGRTAYIHNMDALWAEPTPRPARTTIDRKPYVGADGLSRRTVSSWSPAAFGVTKGSFTAGSGFTRWDRKISIKLRRTTRSSGCPNSRSSPRLPRSDRSRDHARTHSDHTRTARRRGRTRRVRLTRERTP